MPGRRLVRAKLSDDAVLRITTFCCRSTHCVSERTMRKAVRQGHGLVGGLAAGGKTPGHGQRVIQHCARQVPRL